MTLLCPFAKDFIHFWDTHSVSCWLMLTKLEDSAFLLSPISGPEVIAQPRVLFLQWFMDISVGSCFVFSSSLSRVWLWPLPDFPLGIDFSFSPKRTFKLRTLPLCPICLYIVFSLVVWCLTGSYSLYVNQSFPLGLLGYMSYLRPAFRLNLYIRNHPNVFLVLFRILLSGTF